jgi:phosphatidate cytidylyltransferase
MLPAAGRNLAVRLATSAVAVPVVVAVIYGAPPWCFFFAIVLPVILVGSYEFCRMSHPGDWVVRVICVLEAAAASTALYLWPHDPRVVLSVLVGVPLLAPAVTLARLGSVDSAAGRLFALGYGPLMVAAPLALLAAMRWSFGDSGPGAVILALGIGWLGDTGAYFVGRRFGRHKLYEAVSPKKTIEGAVGGLAASLTWSCIASATFLHGVLSLPEAVGLGIVAGVLGQVGDLGESLIKRSTGVKDSGVLVPGHGGILDRVDSILMTSAVVFLYARWMGWN